MNGVQFGLMMAGSLALGTLTLSACSSIESTYLTRDANGNLKKSFVTAGVPITVTAGDRQAFLVTEAIYQLPDGQKIRTQSISSTPIVLGQTEVFTVDTKRPAVGTASNTISLQSQYPTTIGTNVSDNTLPAVVAALSSLLPSKGGEFDFTNVSSVPDNAKLLGQRQYFLVWDESTKTFTSVEAGGA